MKISKLIKPLPGLYLVDELIRRLAQEQGQDSTYEGIMLAKARQAIYANELRVCDPVTGDLLLKGDERSPLTTLQCFNDWRKSCGGHLLKDTTSSEPHASAPQVALVSNVQNKSMLATRTELIAAFGAFTGMDGSWFKKLKDTPSLLAARKVTGQGGRGHIQEPFFCPFEVLEWLISSKRKKGKNINVGTGWRMLEKNFPMVYKAHYLDDPREVD